MRQDLPFIEVVYQRPLQHAHWRQDCIIQQLIHDVNADSRLLGPVLHDTGDDLATGGFGAGPDGEQTVFAALDVREDMRERFGAEKAYGGDISIGERDKDVGDALLDGKVLNGVYAGFDFGVSALFDKVGEVFSGGGVRGFWGNVSSLDADSRPSWTHGQKNI